jgi:GntR family transcriptional regulator/MocR family aminotransferase
VAIENPSIPEQAAIVAGHGLEIVNVDVDEDGLVVEQLQGSAAGAVLVTPAHQFPLGAVLSPARRQALVAWAAERDALIVENDYDAEFRYDGPPIGAVQGLAPGRTACIGTTSKTLAPAVRLGWIAAPAAIAAQVAELQTHRAGFSGLNAHVLAQLMLTGAYERHVQRCRREYRRRRDALLEAISRELPELSALGAAGGLHLTLLLSPGMDATAVAEAARPLGLEIAPLSYYERGQTGKPPGLVVGYGRLPTAGVARAVKALSRALATTRASTGDRGRS